MKPPGLAYTPNTPLEEVPWRVKIRKLKSVEFDDDRKAIFLHALQKYGKYTMACLHAQVTVQQFELARLRDEDFADAAEMTKRLFEDHRVHQLEVEAMKGHTEPIFGANGEVGERTRYESGLRAMILKAYDPERYREKQEIEVTHGGSVVYMPAMLNPEEWEAQFVEHQGKFESITTQGEEAAKVAALLPEGAPDADRNT